ncbi:MAG TPA: FkbM family methyltransferase [Puia sp.]|nr:FkbM family methyltransferase [Puia sp.]
MAIKKILLNILGEKNYLSLVANAFPGLYSTGLLGKEYQDIYFLKKFIRPGDYCADIGAHLGYFTLQLSRLVGPQGKVFAVEPMPPFHRTLQRLLERKHADNVTLYQVALGGDGDYVEMGIPASGGRKHFARARVMDAHPDLAFHTSGSVRIKNESGDRLFSDLPRLDYIKCDVEGLEHKVFASLTKTLEKHRPILLCEFFDRDLRIRFFDVLRPFGYLPFVLERGGLLPIDIDAPGQILTQNDYFIPQQHLGRMRPLIKGS